MSAKILPSEIKEIKALQQKKFRDAQGLFVAEGHKVVREALETGAPIQMIYGTERPDWLPETAPFKMAGSKDMDRMSGLKSSPNLLAIVTQNKQQPALPSNGLILAMDGVRDPGNFGSMLRSAEWFGARAILCSEDCVEVSNPKVVQASMGSVFRVPVISGDLKSLLETCRASGFQVFRAEMEGEDALRLDFPENSVLLIGSESHGIRLDSEDQSITIPAFGQSESLNASVAAAILLSNYRRSIHVTKA